jgi:hypothetical protein
MQLPEPEAILTNKLNIDDLEQSGATEYEAANHIFNFLAEYTNKTNGCTLCGYNSNSFDLNFLRNLLIRYGWNPYFRGKLKNKDILHYVEYLFHLNPTQFPKILRQSEKHQFYSFKLEDISAHFKLLTKPQTHNAIEDVELTIKLIKHLDKQFQDTPFSTFSAIQLAKNDQSQSIYEYGKSKTRDFANHDATPSLFKYTHWLKILSSKKEILLLNLDKINFILTDETTPETTISQLTSAQIQTCLKYVNFNKAFLHLEQFESEDEIKWAPFLQDLTNHSFFSGLNWSSYFSLIKKDWDIDYQIHNLGFDNIDILRSLCQNLLSQPESYESILNHLLASPKTEQNTNLIRLFNRIYLNFHPCPRADYCRKYIIPRYVTGSLLRDLKDFKPLANQINSINTYLSSPTLSEPDIRNLKSLKKRYESLNSTYLDKTRP